MPFDERLPTPTNPWTLNNLPIVIGWLDDRPAVLSGPQTESDPWAAEEPDWKTVHVVATQVADNVDRRGGKESDPAPTRCHRAGPRLAVDPCRHCSAGRVAVRTRHRRARRAAWHGGGAGAGRRPGRGPRARSGTAPGARPRGRPDHHGAPAPPAEGDEAAVAHRQLRAAERVARAPPARPRPDRRRVPAGEQLTRAEADRDRGRDDTLVQRAPLTGPIVRSGRQSPVVPSSSSRRMSRWPRWRAVSSIMWTYTKRRLNGGSPSGLAPSSSRRRPAAAARDRSQAAT